MAVYFVDSSALVKRYLKEVGTAWVMGLFRPHSGHRIHTAEITLVEVIAALARRQKGNRISPANAAKSMARFRRAYRTKFFKVMLDSSLLEQAANLAEKHALRGYDAVQLAAASEVQRIRAAAGASALIFVSADATLNSAAQSEGLLVDNPDNHP